MSTYFSNKIKYLTDDIKLENFDLSSKLDELRSILQDEKSPFFWSKLQEVSVQFQITTPDYELLDKFYELGKIKSHEFVAIVDRVKETVKNAITIMVNTMDYTINQYLTFKHSITINRFEHFQKQRGPKSKRIDKIEIICNPERLTIQNCFAFLKWWSLEEFSFSEQVRIEVLGKCKGENNTKNVMNTNLEKKPLNAINEFISLDDFELTCKLLTSKHYFEIFKSYMFPEGFDSNAEITLDIAKEGKFPQKRRTVSIDGSKMKFHQLITKTTLHSEFQKIIKENRIAGLYCSVKSTNDDLLYLLIDIDVPSILYSMFPPQQVWELTLNIAKAISKTASRFGLPSFKINFSGAKGLHMLLSIESPEVLTDTEHYVNIPELYSYTLLPGINTLKKEKISSINDKFKFAKSLLQSLLLYTVYKNNIEIPEEIKYKLRISHPYQLFRLSPDSKNRLSILLDCSSMSRGVFRLFSPHPSSKLVSIPLSAEKLCERYLDYNNVREEAKLERVIAKFETDEVALFLHTPNKINRNQIQKLLRPDRLLPALAILLRFGTIYSIMRSPKSFSFWYRFFELRSYYGYIESVIFNYDRKDFNNFIANIENMTNRLKIENKDQVIALIKLYLMDKKISFPLFKHRLLTLYYIEFFFTLKSNIFLREYETQLLELFENEMEFGNFLNQAQQIFNIAVDTISSHIILNKETDLSRIQINCMGKLYSDAISLIKFAHIQLEDLTSNLEATNKEDQLIAAIFFVIRLYFTSLIFIREFHNVLKQPKVIKTWR